MPNKRYILFLFIGILFSLQTKAQKSDSVTVLKQDSSKPAPVVKQKIPYPNPQKAMLYSAILPGLGQLYCKSYWRIPIIYAGIGVASYFIVTNAQQYNIYNSAYKERTNNQVDPFINIYSTDNLLTIKNYYQRNLQLSVIAVAFIYILNVVDANVDAELHNFDVTDDISVHFAPNLVPNPLSGGFTFQPGFSLVKRI
jgi:hypothetical protein